MGGGAGRVRNVQQVVLSGLVLIALLSWPKAYEMFTNTAPSHFAVTQWPKE